MKRNILHTLFFIVTCLLSFSAYSQKNITLENIFEGKLYPHHHTNIQWLKNSKTLLFSDKDNIYKQTNANDKEILISLNVLNKHLKTEFNGIPRFTVLDSATIRFFSQTAFYDYNFIKSKTTTKHIITASYRNFDYSSRGDYICQDAKNTVIWYKGDKTIIKPWGKYWNSDSIYRNEFGYNKGTFWSPQENKCALILKDDSSIPDYYMLEYEGTNTTINTHKYAFSGKAYEKIKILTVDLETKKQQEILLKTPQGYYTNPSWNKSETKFYLFYLNREQDSCALEEYDVSTGKYVRTIFSETHKAYVEPLFPIYFTKDDNSFFFISRKDGYMHIYSHNLKNNTTKQISKGSFEVADVICTLKNGDLLFTANTELDIRDRQIYITSGDSILQVSTEKGWHKAKYNSSENLILNEYTNTYTSTVYNVYSINNKVSQHIDSTKNPLSEFNMPTIEYGTIIASDDSTLLHYSIIKPFDFDSTKQYPVIIDVYGGPHYQNITTNWLNGYDIKPYFLASHGYIVFSLDNRGSGNRGMKFECVTHLSLGTKETEDQKLGIDFLHTKQYIDTSKIGVMGWSYGGYMSLTLANAFPKTIKACFAGSPVIDWNFYEVMYGERYMNTPQDNTAGYKNTSLLHNISKDLCPTLLVTGGQDIVTVQTQSQQFIKNCYAQNITIDQQFYPDQGHHIYGAYAFQMYNRFLKFFNTNLNYNN